MRIVYCIHATFNSGGMERVLANKVNCLAEKLGYDILIVTTEQKERMPFFKMHSSIKQIDLDINYSDDNGSSFYRKVYRFFKKKKIHKERLSELLFKVKPDIVVSMFGNEVSFICDIKDGSKKILEIHFSKYFRFQEERTGLWAIVDWVRSKQDEGFVSKFDRFVVLTNEDKEYWGNYKNIMVIPNASGFSSIEKSNLESKKVIAVGRLSFQKGYDRLIKAWKIVNLKYPDWQLEIYGDGELYDVLMTKIINENLAEVIHLNKPVQNITSIYLDSSILVLSSRYEGLPMVLLEAFAHGVPVVSFTCKCGPRDVVSNMEDGILVEEGNIPALADGILSLISNTSLRKRMGMNGFQKVQQFSEKKIMNEWITLFELTTEN